MVIIHRSRFLHRRTALRTSARHPFVLFVVLITAALALALTRRGVAREAPCGVDVVFVVIVAVTAVVTVVIFEKVAIDVPQVD
jgi:hypothetical protein